MEDCWEQQVKCQDWPSYRNMELVDGRCGGLQREGERQEKSHWNGSDKKNFFYLAQHCFNWYCLWLLCTSIAIAGDPLTLLQQETWEMLWRGISRRAKGGSLNVSYNFSSKLCVQVRVGLKRGEPFSQSKVFDLWFPRSPPFSLANNSGKPGVCLKSLWPSDCSSFLPHRTCS